METRSAPGEMSGQPSHPGSSVAIVDDARLLELSREPARPLFPILDRAKAIRPLVLLLAAIPFVNVMEGPALRESDSIWGLKASTIHAATNWSQMLSPTFEGPGQAWQWSPPLGSWLTALSMMVFGHGNVFGLFAISGAATMLLVLALFRLVCCLSDERHGIIAVCLLATAWPVLQMARNAAPESVGCLFCVIAIWSFVSHLIKHAHQVITLRLLASGVFLGLSVLAAGSYSVVISGILAVFLICLANPNHCVAKNGSHSFWKGLASFAIVVVLAFAVGGWWIVIMRSRLGTPFWSEWWNGIYVPPLTGEVRVEPLSVTQSLVSAAKLITTELSFVVGLTIGGAVRAVIELGRGFYWRGSSDSNENPTAGLFEIEKKAESRPRSKSGLGLCLLLVIWILVSGTYLVLLVRAGSTTSLAVESSVHFLALPSLLLAAVTCLRIIDRTITSYEVAAILVASLLSFVWTNTTEIGIQMRAFGNVWTMALLFTGAIALPFCLAVFARRNVRRERRCMQITLAFIVVCSLWHVRSRLTQDTQPTDILRQLQTELLSEREIHSCLILVDAPTPMKLNFVLQAIKRNETVMLSPNAADVESADANDGDDHERIREGSWLSAGENIDSVRGLIETLRANAGPAQLRAETAIVLWTTTGTDAGEPISAIPGLKQLFAPRLFEGRFLEAYRIEDPDRSM